MTSKIKQARLRAIQDERLHEFDHQTTDHYEERKIGNEWWVKSFNGGTGRWQVSIFSEQSYQKYKSYSDNKREFDYKINKEND